MRIVLTQRGSGFGAQAGTAVERIKEALTRGVSAAGLDMKSLMRKEVAAGLGERAGQTVRYTLYPRARTSAKPAAQIHHKFYVKRGGVKSDVLAAFAAPTTIRARLARYLAIPLDATVARGRGGKKATVAEMESALNRDLDVVKTDDGRLWLVGYARASRSKRPDVRGRARRAGAGRGKTLFLFRLVRQVALPKRIDVDMLEASAQQILDQRVGQALAGGDLTG